MKIEDIKEGDRVYSFCLNRFAGCVWNLKRSRVKIIRINPKSIRINRVDDNDGKGNAWTIEKNIFKKELDNLYRNREEAYNDWKEAMNRFYVGAKEKLEGYTNKHKDYNWYVYTRDIFKDFTTLLVEGFTEEKYKKIKLKYVEIEKTYFENTLTKFE